MRILGKFIKNLLLKCDNDGITADRSPLHRKLKTYSYEKSGQSMDVCDDLDGADLDAVEEAESRMRDDAGRVDFGRCFLEPADGVEDR